MKSKHLIAYAAVFIIIALVAAVFAINQSKANLKSRCCNECLYGSSHDVRAMDVSFESCSYYASRGVTFASGEVVEFSQECKSYFSSNKMTVSECR